MHLPMKFAVDELRVVAKIFELLCADTKGVIPTAGYFAFHVQYRCFVVEDELLLEQRRMERPVSALTDRYECLAGHVATKYQQRDIVELGSVQKFAPANIGTVYVGRKKETRHCDSRMNV